MIYDVYILLLNVVKISKYYIYKPSTRSSITIGINSLVVKY